MTLLEQFKVILNEKYVSEDGDEYQAEPKQGLSEQEVDALAKQFPNNQIPEEVRELLLFASGFEFGWLDDITFDDIGNFGFENYFPHSVQLTGDGLGNFWILDISQKGQWGNVFYVCHDPAVIVKHSDNLTQFLGHIHEHGKNGSESTLSIIHEKIVFAIWQNDNGLFPIEQARLSDDIVLRDFALSLPDNFFIADLRNQPNQSGFAWGKFGANIEKAIRHETELIWGIEKPIKKGFWSKLFGR